MHSSLHSRCAVLLVCLPVFSLGGCLVPEGAKPTVGYGVAYVSQFMHRGMVQNEKGGIQPELSTSLPAKGDGTLDVLVWGNLDISDDTGDAWFPDGNSGRFSQIDFIGSYSTTLEPVDVEVGVHNYNLQNGDRFVFGARGPTNEVYVKGSTEVLGAVVEATARWDYDEVQDYYAQVGVTESFPVTEDSVSIWTGAWLGYSGKDMSLWNYGLRERGLSDIRATLAVTYQYDPRTSVEFSLNGSKILDSEIAGWFDLIGIETDNFWVKLGLSYTF